MHTWLIALSKLAGAIGVELFTVRNFERPLAENDPGT